MIIKKQSLAVVFLLLVIFACESFTGEGFPKPSIRQPAVAGKFYSDDKGKLVKAIEAFLSDAVESKVRKPIALIAPHAGYVQTTEASRTSKTSRTRRTGKTGGGQERGQAIVRS